MCGISGIVGATGSIDRGRVDRMLATQGHRGPDGRSSWLGCAGTREVALAHNRLAIIDLSEDASQPMFSADERHVLIFNGEIYNYLELRPELERAGRVFRTRSDSEVLLQALIQWGPSALGRLNGMWAFAFLDRVRGTLMLSRDRMGVKPLYLYQHDDRLYFASEIKTILAVCGQRFRVNSMVAERYLEQQQLDAQPETFFEGISSFPASSWLRIDLSAPALDTGTTQRFWSLPPSDGGPLTERDRVAAVRETFIDAVRLRLRSDVPVGVLLSGGIDSSSIAAAAKQALNGSGELRVLAAVNDIPEYNEEAHIDRMARHLGCELHKVRLTADPMTLIANLDRALHHNDEPVGGLANVAHMQLMERAREHGVTVLLTGQGADELTCGYLKYLGFYLQELVKRGDVLAAARTAFAFGRNGTVLRQYSLADARRYIPRPLRPSIADIRGQAAIQASRPLALGLGTDGVVGRQAADLTRFSVPALVHYEDRMSMSHGREMRTPFLDFRLLELLQPMPVKWKLRDGWTKWILRAAMQPDLPPEICWRKDKQGFVTPESLWLARELRATIVEMLQEPMLTAEWGLVNQAALRQRFDQYQKRWGGPFAMRAQDILGPLLLERWARVFSTSLSGAT